MSETTIPISVLHQVVNFSLFFILMFLLLRKKVVAYFAERDASFKSAVGKAQAATAAAEAQRKELQQKLSELESSFASNIEEAQKMAWAQHRASIDEAHEASHRLKSDALATATYESQRAREELREEFLAKAVAGAKIVLTEKIKDPDQKRLQAESVEKIQVAR